MKSAFLDRAVEDIIRQTGDNISSCCFIFPNKRPEYYFKKALSAHITTPLPSPVIYSIEDFIALVSGIKPTEQMQLVFKLFHHYKNYRPDDDFEKFYRWGYMLLRDYDEIDKNLIDTKKLFANLSAVKELESISLEDEDALRFWHTINDGNETPLQALFLENWQLFEQLYHVLNEELAIANEGYAGTAYRKAAELIKSGEYKHPFHKIIFLGFNALSRTEEVIINHYLKNGEGAIYWDIDKYYLNGEAEAGHFIRKSLKNLHISRPEGIIDQLSTALLNIKITGVSLQAGQAKALGAEVENFIKSGYVMDSETAIVLPDENLLIPTLHSLPHDLAQFNITGGNALRLNAMFTFIESLFSLQENYIVPEDKFYYKDIKAILSHAYFSNKDYAIRIINHIETEQLVFVDRKAIQMAIGAEIIGIIFTPVNSFPAISNYLLQIIDIVNRGQAINETDSNEAISHFYHIIKDLTTFLHSQQEDINMHIFHRFFREQVAQVKMPFSENAPDACQIMGTLETRCLNFKNIFILSMNEGKLPSSHKNHSYIPFDLRKAFGLPTFDEQDALYAYYFYRLLQGAENVFLYYNNNTQGNDAEEKSRYIRQIEILLSKANPQLKITNEVYSIPVKITPPAVITLKKEESYFETIRKRSSDENKGLSPSYISTYYRCPLNFFLNYIAGIQPQEEVIEDLEANHFGNLFHRAMEIIYTPVLGKEISAGYLINRKKELDAIVSSAIQLEHKSQQDFIAGRNSLLIETIKILVEKTLDEDISYAPFRVLHLEEKQFYTLPMQFNGFDSIRLQGTIDRIDEKDGITRIVDYKTGSVKKLSFNFEEPEEMLSVENKEAFQVLFYSWIYHKNIKTNAISATILPLKDINNGYQAVNKGGILNEKDFTIFEAKLKTILENILNPAELISQTEDETICASCQYNNICLK